MATTDPSTPLRFAQDDQPKRRARPENGGIVWRARANTFECEGCGELIPQQGRVWMNPELHASC